MKLILPLCLAVLLSACAGSALDQDFRQKVSGLDATPQMSYDSTTGTWTGGMATHLTFRDPRTQGLAK